MPCSHSQTLLCHSRTHRHVDLTSRLDPTPLEHACLDVDADEGARKPIHKDGGTHGSSQHGPDLLHASIPLRALAPLACTAARLAVYAHMHGWHLYSMWAKVTGCTSVLQLASEPFSVL